MRGGSLTGRLLLSILLAGSIVPPLGLLDQNVHAENDTMIAFFGSNSINQVYAVNSAGTGETMLTADKNDREPSYEIAATNTLLSPDRDWEGVTDFAYQLQDTDLGAIGDTKYDLIIMDYSADGSDDARFTSQQINALKNSAGGNKLVLSYMSIGEAEDYRWYWQDCCDADAPSWLGPENPDWEGNYKVKYWDPGWQAIIFNYVDKVIEAGFDGVYLDIIDAYEYWGPDGDSGLDRATAEQDMVDFVIAIAEHARVTKGQSDFGVFPQNGEALSSHSEYVEVVTGIGKEDVWYDDNSKQSKSEIKQVTQDLDVFKDAGKLVFVIDYPTKQKAVDDFYKQALAKGYIPYAADRDLDTLKIVYLGPDVEISSISSPSEIETGETMAFSVKLTNNGLTPLTAEDTFAMNAYLSEDVSISDDDVLLTEEEISKQIKSKSNITIKSSVQVPAETAPGTYYLLVEADSNNDLMESNEDNNISSNSIAIEGVVIGSFSLSHEGTTSLTKPKGEFEAGSYIVTVALAGEYQIKKGKVTADSDSLSGSISIDDHIHDLEITKLSVSKDKKSISYSANMIGMTGKVTGTLKFSSAINFENAIDQDAYAADKKKNSLNATMDGVKFDTKKTSSGSIAFS